MGYETGGLRQGGSQALGAGQTAAGAAGILRGVSCPSASLGLVAGADALAAAMIRARDAHARWPSGCRPSTSSWPRGPGRSPATVTA